MVLGGGGRVPDAVPVPRLEAHGHGPASLLAAAGLADDHAACLARAGEPVMLDTRALIGHRPRLLDLFCGAGGAAMGYHRAGFDVTGVDIRPQPRYPFEFHQADAMTFPLDGWDAIHASPPCQDYIRGRGALPLHGTGWMLPETRRRLAEGGMPWVIENVPGAPMRPDLILCGCMVGLPNLKRERWFETSWQAFDLRPPCDHREPVISVTGTGAGTSHARHGHIGFADWRRVMGIDWMTGKELAQAIPPAYTEYIGRELAEVMARTMAG